MEDQKPRLPSRVHPDERDRIEGLNILAKRHYGTPQANTPVSYYTPILMQCTLPHSDPKTPTWGFLHIPPQGYISARHLVSDDKGFRLTH